MSVLSTRRGTVVASFVNSVYCVNMVYEDLNEQRKARRRQARIDELLDEGLLLVAEEGLDALTVARLARRMDWTKGAMYRYFRGKDELVAALNARVLDRWSQAAREAVEGLDAPLDRLEALVGSLRLASAREPHAFGMVALTMADPRNLVADPADAVHIPQMMGLLRLVTVELERAHHDGLLTPGDPLARALRLVFSLIGVLQLRKLERFGRATFSADAHADAVFKDYLAAWGATPA